MEPQLVLQLSVKMQGGIYFADVVLPQALGAKFIAPEARMSFPHSVWSQVLYDAEFKDGVEVISRKAELPSREPVELNSSLTEILPAMFERVSDGADLMRYRYTQGKTTVVLPGEKFKSVREWSVKQDPDRYKLHEQEKHDGIGNLLEDLASESLVITTLIGPGGSEKNLRYYHRPPNKPRPHDSDIVDVYQIDPQTGERHVTMAATEAFNQADYYKKGSAVRVHLERIHSDREHSKRRKEAIQHSLRFWRHGNWRFAHMRSAKSPASRWKVNFKRALGTGYGFKECCHYRGWTCINLCTVLFVVRDRC